MVIRGMNLPLITACIVIILALIILHLTVSYKAKKKRKITKMSGIKLKNMEIELITKQEKNINRNNEKIIIVSANYSFF